MTLDDDRACAPSGDWLTGADALRYALSCASRCIRRFPLTGTIGTCVEIFRETSPQGLLFDGSSKRDVSESAQCGHFGSEGTLHRVVTLKITRRTPLSSMHGNTYFW